MIKRIQKTKSRKKKGKKLILQRNLSKNRKRKRLKRIKNKSQMSKKKRKNNKILPQLPRRILQNLKIRKISLLTTIRTKSNRSNQSMKRQKSPRSKRLHRQISTLKQTIFKKFIRIRKKRIRSLINYISMMIRNKTLQALKTSLIRLSLRSIKPLKRQTSLLFRLKYRTDWG